MKGYPKIHRQDHPVVPEAFFDPEDLVVVENFDGSVFGFTLYRRSRPSASGLDPKTVHDERYTDAYPENVVDAVDEDEHIVFGTRKSTRGRANDDLEETDGALHREVGCMRSYLYHYSDSRV